MHLIAAEFPLLPIPKALYIFASFFYRLHSRPLSAYYIFLSDQASYASTRLLTQEGTVVFTAFE